MNQQFVTMEQNMNDKIQALQSQLTAQVENTISDKVDEMLSNTKVDENILG